MLVGMDVPGACFPLPDGSSTRLGQIGRPKLTAEERERVLGKHRHGANVADKSEFPERWTDSDIIAAIELTLAEPENSGISGDKATFERFVDGVLVRARIRIDGRHPRFWTAYPVER